ncbi:hypothetical protein PYW08_013595 [Mythimna loreyi]|uniref:Uncharacterized protein n=1 Tax=Mythimna loreyi TaxID=667449 RepID=A0ACC2QHZ3_9NEOP|nr:hypothetical protein PYW08_013595 [Mythimna loreyi]
MLSIYNTSSHDELAALANRYVPSAMSLNGTTYLGGGVLILTKTLTGESVEVIDEPKANKTTDIIDVKIVQVAFCILYTVIFVLGVFGAKNTRREEADRDRKRRTNRMLISMVAIFGISWLPINLINIFNDFYAQMTEWNYYFVSFFLAHSMAMASTCYNPFLYAWLNENFRKEFKQVLPFFESTGGVRNSYHSGRMPTHKADKICNVNRRRITAQRAERDEISNVTATSSLQRCENEEYRYSVKYVKNNKLWDKEWK